MSRYNPLLRKKKKPKNLFERKGNFKRHLRIPHSSPSSPIIHFSRAHAVPWTLNFFPANSSIVSARLNSISIHAKSAPNSLFDPVARLLYVYMCVYVCVCTTLIPHAPPYTRNSLHIPRIYIESSDIFHRSYSAQHCGTLVTRTFERDRRSFNLVTSIASLLEYRELIEAEGMFE